MNYQKTALNCLDYRSPLEFHEIKRNPPKKSLKISGIKSLESSPLQRLSLFFNRESSPQQERKQTKETIISMPSSLSCSFAVRLLTKPPPTASRSLSLSHFQKHTKPIVLSKEKIPHALFSQPSSRLVAFYFLFAFLQHER